MSNTDQSALPKSGLEGLSVEHHVTMLIDDSSKLTDLITCFEARHCKLKYVLMQAVRDRGYEVSLRVADPPSGQIQTLISSIETEAGVRSAKLEHLIARSR